MRALVILADGFEEIETVAVVDILRRANIDTILVALKKDTVHVVGSHQLRLVPDAFS